ncbi:AAA domain containing protein [uncultured Caudovirales phage]|uniref:AAA domain containing protein n=1 Tax=uncultured Caudovirales phage TaxID=2100421 RepID=A0A6J5M7M3_9CAUD|nr:AAA domain containing protein [uncultured Caudovirales phage]
MNQPFQIRKAERKKSKLRLGISAPSGAGKTYSSLLIAAGIGKKIGVIDTENGSGDLYDNLIEGGYDIITLAPPFEPSRYVQAIKTFEQAGYDVIIIDSLSHAWSGTGGLLDKQGKIADKEGNSYTAWRKVTPEHNKLVETLLQSPAHIIATMRAKTEYVQEKDESTGKTRVRKVGMAPIMRDGIEYEFTAFLEIDHQHVASASKDRTGMFDGKFFTPDTETGKQLLAWLDSGAEPPKPPAMKDEDVAHFTAKMAVAATMPELSELFKAGYKAARDIGDTIALQVFESVKDKRKAELTAAPQTPIVPAAPVAETPKTTVPQVAPEVPADLPQPPPIDDDIPEFLDRRNETNGAAHAA